MFISTDFAPNQSAADAWVALKMLIQPWKWYDKLEERKLRDEIARQIPGFHQFAHDRWFFSLTGRSLINDILSAYALEPGSEVAVTGFTCEAVILPILARGLVPVYVDIDRHDLTMDYDDLVSKISPKTRVIILQYTFGLTPGARKRIYDLCWDRGIILIEDRAHGVIDDPDYPTLPHLEHSCTFFSFGRSKQYSSFFGAAVATNDDHLIERLPLILKKQRRVSRIFLIRSLLYVILTPLIKSLYPVGIGKIMHSITRSLHLFPPEISDKEKKGSFDTYYAHRFPAALATLLRAQLSGAARTDELRSQAIAMYDTTIAPTHVLAIPPDQPLARYPLVVRSSKERNMLIKRLGREGIHLGTWYSQPIAPSGVNLALMGYTPGSCPTSEKVCESIVNLPTRISVKDARHIGTLIQSILHDA